MSGAPPATLSLERVAHLEETERMAVLLCRLKLEPNYPVDRAIEITRALARHLGISRGRHCPTAPGSDGGAPTPSPRPSPPAKAGGEGEMVRLPYRDD